jgi:hypothetical protein
MAYLTLDDVKTYLKINSPNDDLRLQVILDHVCELVQSYLGRRLEANSYTEYYDGGRSSVFVKNIPVNNVTVVSEYDGTDYVTLFGPNTDGSLPNTASNSNSMQYIFYSDTGEVTRNVGLGRGNQGLQMYGPLTFKNYPKGVRITYNGGYITVPSDIKLATLDLIKVYHKDINMQSASFQGESFRQFDMSANFPMHVRRILEMHRVMM